MKPYQRGDVVVIDIPMLANSHIQAGKRPWVVVQNNVGNQFSSTSIVVPLTTKIKRLELPTHVAVTWGSLQPSMVGRRLSGLCRRSAGESDEKKEVRIYGSIYQSN